VNPQKVYRAIDWELLTLFAGLFVVVGAVEQSGLSREFFRWAGEDKMQNLPYLAAVSAVLSNLVSNVPAVLLFRSFIPQLSDPHTSWLVLAMASTLAGNLTLLGSIANLIVVQGARNEVKISFWEYARLGIPLTLITLGIGLIRLLEGKP
jgi:Na+/H+ antiporter NhaD/arsenite permease-like protein